MQSALPVDKNRTPQFPDRYRREQVRRTEVMKQPCVLQRWLQSELM
jgi:hypothetical protein